MVLRILGAKPHQWYLIYCTIITKNNLLHYNAIEIAHVPHWMSAKERIIFLLRKHAQLKIQGHEEHIWFLHTSLGNKGLIAVHKLRTIEDTIPHSFYLTKNNS